MFVWEAAPAPGRAGPSRSGGRQPVGFDETAEGRRLEARAGAFGDLAAGGSGSLRPGVGRRAVAGPTGPTGPTGPPPGLAAGEPLADGVRAAMEGRLGCDLTAVRVHVGEPAAAAAAAVSARAFTMGSHIVFGAGRYRPEHPEGRRLLGHELAHVVQQASGLGTVLQRDKDPAAPPLPRDPVRDELARREAEWQALRAVAATESPVKSWIARGDEVVRLLRTHTEAALAARSAGDGQLLRQYTGVVETDVVAFRYVAAHVVLYTHLAKLRSRAHSLVASFDADKRAFSGRARAEEETRVLAAYTDAAQRESDALVARLRTDVHHQLASATGAVAVTLTSAADARIRSEMQAETSKAVDLQAKVNLLVVDILGFLATAQAEGLAQAVEAVEEFYKVKGIIDKLSGGSPQKNESPEPSDDKEPSSDKQVQPEPLPMPVPAPMPEPGDDEDEKKKGEVVFRGMIEDGGRPKVEPSARGLGVRPDADVDVVNGIVKANGKGMSMARLTPLNLPAHRRPPEWGGTGKDPVWTTYSRIFTGPLHYNPDTPIHANAAAAIDMPIAAMQGALGLTRPLWAKATPDKKAQKKPAATSRTTPPAPGAKPPEKAPH